MFVKGMADERGRRVLGRDCYRWIDQAGEWEEDLRMFMDAMKNVLVMGVTEEGAEY